MRYVHTTEYYSPIKKSEVLTDVTTWKNLKNVMLSEESQKQVTYNIQFHLHGISQ